MQEQNSTPGNFEAAYKLGSEKIIQLEVNGHPVAIIPQGMKAETFSELVEKYRETPLSLVQNVEALSVESFIDYYNRFCSDESTIFFNPVTGRFKAIFDYHKSPTEPAFKRHTLAYLCPKTKEWDAWVENNNKKMPQEEFALFIEDNLKQISDPEPQVMLEIASSLKATKDVEFKSGVRLADGQVQFAYVENLNGRAGAAGNLQIPEQLTLTLQPFVKGAPYVVQARFRYRVSSSGLSMWYTLISPHLSFQHAIDEVAEAIDKQKSKGQLLQAVCE
jgi:uncharacterized protein YfdQ (DUF2303 family)